MAFGGSSTYQPGSSTTTVQARPGGVDPTAAIMAMIAREKLAFDQGITPAAPAPAPKMAAPTAPTISRPAPTSTDAARALAHRSSGGGATPSFVHLSGVGPQQVSGWTDAPEGAGNVFGGWRVTDGGGPVSVGQSSRANSRLADTPFTAGPSMAQPQDDGTRADFYGLSRRR